MRNPKLASILALACLGASANATLIDNFLPVDHALDRSLPGNGSVSTSYVEAFQGYGIGGERDLEFYLVDPSRATAVARYERVTAETFEAFRFGALGPGLPGPGTRFEASLQYDGIGDETGNQGAGKRLTNSGQGNALLNGTEGGFRIWYWDRFVQAGMGARITLRNNSSAIAEVTREIGTVGGRSLVACYFEFDSEDLALADSITITLFGDTGTGGQPTIFLSHIDTILPEPGTYAIFGGGLAYVACRRKRRAR